MKVLDIEGRNRVLIPVSKIEFVELRTKEDSGEDCVSKLVIGLDGNKKLEVEPTDGSEAFLIIKALMEDL